MARLGARAGIICCQKRNTCGGKGKAHVGARAGHVWGARSRHVWEKGTCEGKGEACVWQRRGTLWGKRSGHVSQVLQTGKMRTFSALLWILASLPSVKCCITFNIPPFYNRKKTCESLELLVSWQIVI